MVYRSLLLALLVTLLACSSNKGDKSKIRNKSNGSEEVKAITKPANESEMIYFKGGSFMMGSLIGLPNEQPVHEVTIKSFKIDKYPVTVGDFRRFVQETGFKTDAEKFGDSGVFDFKTLGWILIPGANWQYPMGEKSSQAADNHPVTQVSWNDAKAYAQWIGKRLPSEAEWEYAARCGGTSKTRFSWGDNLILGGKYMANVWQGKDLSAKQGDDGFDLTSPVGHYGETPCGMADMGGNVWNWCSDIYKPYPGSDIAFQHNPELIVIRGGSFFFDQNGENSYTSTGRAFNTQETSLFNTGFRCAVNTN